MAPTPSTKGHFARSQVTSARICQHICETSSPCFHTAFAGIRLHRSSLLPDFASRFVKSLALECTEEFTISEFLQNLRGTPLAICGFGI